MFVTPVSARLGKKDDGDIKVRTVPPLLVVLVPLIVLDESAVVISKYTNQKMRPKFVAEMRCRSLGERVSDV